MAKKILLPTVKKEAIISGQSSDEEILFFILKNSPAQQRISMRRHPLLDQAAWQKAEDMARQDYFAHTSPQGITANENVRSIGYVLPDFYPEKGNNIESLSIGGGSPQDTADGWLGSPKHRPHVYGENEFYQSQQCFGIGKSVAKDKRPIYVCISAPCI